MGYIYIYIYMHCMAVLFIFIGRMQFLASTLDNSYPLFALVATPGFYLHHVEVTDQDPAIVAVYKQIENK